MSRDHVPPRALLEKPYPINLKRGNACITCNNGYAADEQYLLVLLGEIGNSKTIKRRVAKGGQISRTLDLSPQLRNRLFNAIITDDEDGIILIAPELERVRRIIAKVALGLFVIRYGKLPNLDEVTNVQAYPYNIEDSRPSSYFIATFTERFRNKQWRHVQRDVFSYIFVRDPKSSSRVWCIMDIHRTLWGVAHLPNPKSVRVRNNRQLWLFSNNPS